MTLLVYTMHTILLLLKSFMYLSEQFYCLILRLDIWFQWMCIHELTEFWYTSTLNENFAWFPFTGKWYSSFKFRINQWYGLPRTNLCIIGGEFLMFVTIFYWIINFIQWRKIKIDIWLITIKISLIGLLAKAINVATVNSVMFLWSLHVCLSISFPLSSSPSVLTLTLSPLYSLSLSPVYLFPLSLYLCPPPPPY